jgi:plastocyanin domain-containing protein
MLSRAALVVPTLLALAGCGKTHGESPPVSTSAAPSSSAPANAVRASIKVVAGAYEPAEVHLKKGVPGILEFTRVAESDCVNAVKMPWMKEAVDLPLNQKVEIPVDTSKAGTFTYSCWMNMVFGKVTIDP